MATGRQAFGGNTVAVIHDAILNRTPPPVSSLNSDAPPKLEEIIGKCLEKDRKLRCQSAAELHADLKRLKRDSDRIRAATVRERAIGPEPAPSGHDATPTPATPHAPNAVIPIPPQREKDLLVAGPSELPRPEPPLPSGRGSDAVAAARRRGPGAFALRALAGLALVAVVSLAYFFWPRGEMIDSVAVLPFVNSSADPDTEYLSDGITESLINSLSQLPQLRVIPRSVAFRYKGQNVDPQQVGRELNVRAVLTGRLVQRGDTINIQTELIDVSQVSQLWGEQYNRRLADLVAMQEDISMQIANRLRMRLTGEEEQRLTKRYTENAEAYQLYLRGRFWWNKRTEEGFTKATEYFQQAIAVDPTYAMAYSGLADAHALPDAFGLVLPQEGFPKAKAAALKALELDDMLAEAHASLGWISLTYERDWLRAETELRRAIELNPGNATAHQWNALRLRVAGRFDEAIVENRRAVELDPLTLITNSVLADSFMTARQYDQAIEQYKSTIELDPNWPTAHASLGLAYIQKGMHREAVAECERGVQLSRRSVELGALGYAYAMAGRRTDALKVLDQLNELSTQRYVPAFSRAIIYTGLGDKDRAIEWLGKAVEERSSLIVIWSPSTFAAWDPLRSDPRFQDLLRRMGL
jgi:TolB-like protein/Tfp pilus assembly protein PilF